VDTCRADLGVMRPAVVFSFIAHENSAGQHFIARLSWMGMVVSHVHELAGVVKFLGSAYSVVGSY